MKRRHLKYLIAIFLLVIIYHTSFLAYSFKTLYDIKKSKVKLLHRVKGVNVYLTYGKAILPKEYMEEIDYDAVVFLYPLEEDDIWGLWGNEKKFHYRYLKDRIFDIFLRNLLNDIWKTDLYALFLQNYLYAEFKIEFDGIKEGDICIKEMPRGYSIFREQKIKILLFIPILIKEELLQNDQKIFEKYRRDLKEKIISGINRIFINIPSEKHIYSVAFPLPELGVSQKAQFLLNYYQAFDAILFAIVKESEFPKSLEKAYIVIRDDLPDKEFSNAIRSFIFAYYKFKLNTEHSLLVGLFAFVFYIGFVCSLRTKGEENLKKHIFLVICTLSIFIIPLLWFLFKFIGKWLIFFNLKTRFIIEIIIIIAFFYLGRSWLFVEEFYSKLRGKKG